MYGILAQLGEHLPYKQGVTGSSPVTPTKFGQVVQLVRMPACHAGGRRFEPDPDRQLSRAGIAQLVEQLICNQQVGGSSPSTSSISFQLHTEEFPSGQRGQTVNLLSTTSMVRIHPPPPNRQSQSDCRFSLSSAVSTVFLLQF